MLKHRNRRISRQRNFLISKSFPPMFHLHIWSTVTEHIVHLVRRRYLKKYLDLQISFSTLWKIQIQSDLSNLRGSEKHPFKHSLRSLAERLPITRPRRRFQTRPINGRDIKAIARYQCTRTRYSITMNSHEVQRTSANSTASNRPITAISTLCVLHLLRRGAQAIAR